MNVIEIILALMLISFVLVFINYILGLFNVLPSIVTTYLTLALFISLLMFVIHRGK